jgi:MoxR-like ATPase
LKTSRHANGTVRLPWHDTAEKAVKAHRMLLLVGPPGVGKTTFVTDLATRITGTAPEVVQATQNTQIEEHWSQLTLDGGRTVRIDGPIARAVKTGGFLLIEEINLLPRPELAGLLPLRGLSTIRNLTTGESMDVPESFRVIATSNPDNLRCAARGAAALRALLDDFVIICINEQPADLVRQMLTSQFPGAPEDRVDEVMGEWERFRAVKPEDAESSPDDLSLSYRAASHALALLSAGLSLHAAVEIAYVNKYYPDRDRHQAAQVLHRLGA